MVNLTKKFDDFTAVDHLNLDVEEAKYLESSDQTMRAKQQRCPSLRLLSSGLRKQPLLGLMMFQGLFF